MKMKARLQSSVKYVKEFGRRVEIDIPTSPYFIALC